MDVSNLLSRDPPARTSVPATSAAPAYQPAHQYATRHAIAAQGQQAPSDGVSTPPAPPSGQRSAATTPPYQSPSADQPPKRVSFELLVPNAPAYTARLPMRVQIYRHDTTESIITTVRNFYGLYEGPGGTRGVSFEDGYGNTLIARYENFHDQMNVYVRVVPDAALPYGVTPSASVSPPLARPRHPDSAERGTAHSAQLPPLAHAVRPSRPPSRVARKRSASPASAAGRLSRNGLAAKSRASSFRDASLDSFGDTDGEVARKLRSEQLASAEISLDNIVEGGRRKRAKFESSELPLFVPPQMPLAMSPTSASPADRSTQHLPPSFFAHPDPRAYPNPPALPSPTAHARGPMGPSHGFVPGPSLPMPVEARHEHHLRDRPLPPPSYPTRKSAAAAFGHAPVLPTPEPTIASCISDEDVALQLMRLGDASNLSNETRHSASTVDDGLSGIADVASSAGATSDGDNRTDGTEIEPLPQAQELLPPPPPPHQQRIESSPMPVPGSVKKNYKHLDEILPSSDSTEPSADEATHPGLDGAARAGAARAETAVKLEDGAPLPETMMKQLKSVVDAKLGKTSAPSQGIHKSRAGHPATGKIKIPKSRPAVTSKARPKTATGPAAAMAKTPMSPASMPAHSRKTSTASTINFQHTLREDEEDLSSKPRCQRCRKSKKGCDRQRPCQRCKDAGIGIEGCVSEDETNGRKGRFGRHMGVTVKKGTRVPLPPVEVAPAPAPMSGLVSMPVPLSVAEPVAAAIEDGAMAGLDKNKKRKR